MAIDLIRYDLLVQEALRSIVRKVLADAARDGLPGEHHFSITFKTHAPGVQLSQRMRNEYPNEMTIILQHQFWGLNVTGQAFEVGLSFHKVPETLIIPFEAVTGFFDPSVQFALKFENDFGANDIDGPFEPGARDGEPPHGGFAKPAESEKSQAPGVGLLPAARQEGGVAADAPQSDQTKVVSIDAFRKKP